MEAFLAGNMAEGQRLLEVEKTKLTKAEATRTARAIAAMGRADDAIAVLLTAKLTREQADSVLASQSAARVGDVVYASVPGLTVAGMGVTFYQVTAATKTSATVQQIAKRVASASQFGKGVTPIVGGFIGPAKQASVKKSVVGRKKSYKLIIDGNTAIPWDGSPKDEAAAR